MPTADRQRREHQVKICLSKADAAAIAQHAREHGVGTGTFIRWLTLRHLSASANSGLVRDSDNVKFGYHVSVWFSGSEHARLSGAALATGLTVSAYLGRHVVEVWLRARRGLVFENAEPPKPA